MSGPRKVDWRLVADELAEALETAAFKARHDRGGALVLYCDRCGMDVGEHHSPAACEVAAALANYRESDR